MGRAVSEEQKIASSDLQRTHWERCRQWGRIFGVHHAVIHAHWRCCFSDEPWRGHEGRLSQAQIDEKKESFAPCYRQKATAWAESQQTFRDEERQRQSAKRPARQEEEEEPPPDRAARVKIMLWAINKCGNLEDAKDAFDRALGALDDE